MVKCHRIGRVEGSRHKWQVRLPDGSVISLGKKGFSELDVAKEPAKKSRKVKVSVAKRGEILDDSDWEEHGTEEEIWRPSRVAIDVEEWEVVETISEDARPASKGENTGYALYRNETNSPLKHFEEWFPMAAFFSNIESMNVQLRTRWPNTTLEITRRKLAVFFGLLIRMSVYGLPVRCYWEGNAVFGRPEFWFR